MDLFSIYSRSGGVWCVGRFIEGGGKLKMVMARRNSSASVLPQVFSWVVLLGSAALLGDLTAAGLEQKYRGIPEPYASAVSAVVAPASSSQASLSAVLRQPVVASPSASPQAGKSGRSTGRVKNAGQAGKAGPASLETAQLQGTIVCNGANGGIVEHDEQISVLFMGDELDGWTVTDVQPTYICFEQDEHKALLALASVQDEDNGKTQGSAKQPDEPVVPSRVQPSETPAVDPDARLSLEDIRAELDDTAKMAQQVRVVPQAKDGQPWGTKIVIRDANNIMARMGIQNNDVLLSVNGAPTRSAQDMYQGYMTIRNADALEFVVDRNGAETAVRYELAK